MLFLRGDGVYEFDPNFTGVYTSHKATGLRTYRDSQRLFGHEKNVCVLTNNQSHCLSLENTLRKATQMKIERAFLHHYKKFGVEESQIEHSFLKCEEVLEAYK